MTYLRRITIVMFMTLFVLNVNYIRSAELAKGIELPGFSTEPFMNEQVMTYKIYPDIRVQINAPSTDLFNPLKPTALVLYALPNGNTIEQTVGKVLQSGDNWHFDIQHIGAQTRFVRRELSEYNVVTVYLEAKQLSWPTWKKTHAENYRTIIKTLVSNLLNYFKSYNPYIVLSSHSGGGNFIFSFMDAYDQIPDFVKRVCFLDSDYNYVNDPYGIKLKNWLDESKDHYLSVLAYDDENALYKGKPIVTPGNGTWSRTIDMITYFEKYYKYDRIETSEFIKFSMLDGRIKIVLKDNPNHEILHTVQVYRNGFIHTLLSGTEYDSKNYTYYDNIAYEKYIQPDVYSFDKLPIPIRPADAKSGSEFMNSIKELSFEDREGKIFDEIISGNVPYFMRNIHKLSFNSEDAAGVMHEVEFAVLPDYLAVGSDADFCRTPMGPITAQKIADFLDASLPTRKLVDRIHDNATVHIDPVTYAPVGHENEKVEKFIAHNVAIEEQRAGKNGIIDGAKKDVIISNKITPGYVVIYGWYKLDGKPIQPLYSKHYAVYVDYSHGIRLLSSGVYIDGTKKSIKNILEDENLYTLLSDEEGIMNQPSYIAETNL